MICAAKEWPGIGNPLLAHGSAAFIPRASRDLAAAEIGATEQTVGRTPHSLVALAEVGQRGGRRTSRYPLRITRVTHRREPLRDRYISWDKRQVPIYKIFAHVGLALRSRPRCHLLRRLWRISGHLMLKLSCSLRDPNGHWPVFSLNARSGREDRNNDPIASETH
jgi:hypothetical protein